VAELNVYRFQIQQNLFLIFCWHICILNKREDKTYKSKFDAK